MTPNAATATARTHVQANVGDLPFSSRALSRYGAKCSKTAANIGSSAVVTSKAADPMV